MTEIDRRVAELFERSYRRQPLAMNQWEQQANRERAWEEARHLVDSCAPPVRLPIAHLFLGLLAVFAITFLLMVVFGWVGGGR